VRYGAGQVDGHLVNDVIYAEQNDPSQPSAKVNFVSAYNVQDLGYLKKSHGLIGLSPRRLKETPDDPQRENPIW